MNIYPISFGKAIKINASREVARQLLEQRKDKKNEGTIINSFLNGVFGANTEQDEFIYEVDNNKTYVFTGDDALATRAFVGYGSKGSDTLDSDKMVKIAFDSTVLEDRGILTITKKTKNGETEILLKDACYTDSKGHKLKFNTVE